MCNTPNTGVQVLEEQPGIGKKIRVGTATSLEVCMSSKNKSLKIALHRDSSF